MSEAPLVSVVMAVYNGGEGLVRTLKSLNRQTFQNFELIIVDDGSTDNTWEMLSRLKRSRLRVHRNITNKGQTASLNTGLKLATGRYIVRHDAEDISLPERFERQVDFLERHSEVGLIGTQVDWVDGIGNVIRHFKYPTEHAQIAERLKTKNSFGHGAVMFRRSLLGKLEGYREVFRLAQDYDLWLRMVEHCQAANLDGAFYKMRFSTRMASVARNAEQSAYAGLARKLAAERAEHGKEKTTAAEAAEAIAAEFDKGFVARRMEQATNYINWAERLLWWGGSASRYAWPLWNYAFRSWPLSVRVWKFALRETLRPTAARKSEKPTTPPKTEAAQPAEKKPADSPPPKPAAESQAKPATTQAKPGTAPKPEVTSGVKEVPAQGKDAEQVKRKQTLSGKTKTGSKGKPVTKSTPGTQPSTGDKHKD